MQSGPLKRGGGVKPQNAHLNGFVAYVVGVAEHIGNSEHDPTSLYVV